MTKDIALGGLSIAPFFNNYQNLAGCVW